MQRKKPEKLNFAVAVNNSDYFEGVGRQPPSSQPTNLNETLFFKYASSIIQVVSEDRLDSSMGVSGPQAHQAIFEISEVKEFEEGGWARETPVAQEQNNYNNIAAKMKKKGISRKILAYNFSSISLLCQKINLLVQKQLKNSLIMLRTFSGGNDDLKTKKEIKRASFHSGYTTSTSNEERPSKRNSKKLTEERRREMHKEGANSIKGWLEFKTLMMASQAFSSIKEFTITRTNIGFSQVPTIKQQSLQKFYLTEYQHDNSISIAREISHNISESLVYTADQNFEFTQKEVTLTTPEKFYSDDRLSTPPMPPQMRRVISNQSNQESLVESYKIKQPMPKPPTTKEKIIIATSRPIQMIGDQHRRYLNIRTNIYELPMLSAHQLKPDRQIIFKDPNNLGDHFTRNEPQTCDNSEATLKQINEACNLFKQKLKSPSYFHQRQSDYNKISEKKPFGNSKTAANKKEELQTKKVESRTNTQLIKEQRKADTHKIQNKNVLNQDTFFNASKVYPTTLPQKQPLEQIKSVQSILSSLKSERKNDRPPIRMEESVVNEYMTDLRKKEVLSPPSSKLQPSPYESEHTDRKDQRMKSCSKINIIMQSPPKESPKPSVFHPIQTLKLDNRPSLRINEDKNIGALYGYTHQRPNSPRLMQNEQKAHQIPRMIPPTPNPHNIYQINQGVPFIRQTAPQRMINQVKSNEQFKTQQQIRIEPMNQSPGKVVNPNYLITSQQKRMGGAPSYFRQEDKKSFYSPQITKNNYLLTPQRPKQPFIEPQKVHNPSSIRRMHSDEYFNKETIPNPQLRAINFNNNYYTNGCQTARSPPIISQPSFNVFQQEEPIRRQGYMDRPPSSRQSYERVALFSNYSPLDSQLQLQHQRSNNFSKNSSELSRPKSMNEKIFITLRKEK